MSLLYTDKPLVINPKLAKLIGLNEAIILQQIHYWLAETRGSTGKLINGVKWIYNSITSWEKQFPFMSYRTIQRTLKNLKDSGYLLTGVFNKDKRDKTLWYSIDYQALNKIDNVDHARCQNGIMDDDKEVLSDDANLVPPLPENTTDNTSDIIDTDKSVFVDDESIVQPNDNFLEKNKPTSVKSKSKNIPDCPYSEIVNLYERILPELSRVLVLNEKRKKYLRARWRENKVHQTLDFWKDYFLYVRKSQFLMGNSIPKNGAEPFRADFEWLINPNNFVKVIEGKYVRNI